MKFSLRNLLLVIAFLAAWLGVILSESDKKIRSHAVKMNQERMLIENSERFKHPITQDEIKKAIRSKLTMK